mmetsp:Transcript_32957/g.54425  ORF Transcript_32957/g.54425 Transcript_32957/m.54425 type:complete len:411 (-) Transcript_32957:25-1257(-)
MLRVGATQWTRKVSQPQRRAAAMSSTSSVMDMFINLRWRAAEVLTNGLSPEEKAQLLGTLDGVGATRKEDDPENNDDSTIIQQTIGEAVAAARMEESQRQTSKWEKERESLLREAEAAARARVESDLLVQERRVLAMGRWQKELSAEEQASAISGATTITSTTSSIAHPILGAVVVDLGYKRVYQVSAAILASIPVWKKQRVYRHDRAKVIATDKMKTLPLGMPGIVVLHEDQNGKLSILDGQHRVGALALLSKKAPEGLDLDGILVEVYTSNDSTNDSAEAIFVEINKSEPIKLVDMPGVAKAGDRKIITSAAAKLHKQYPEMFKPSQQCRPPHLNVDNLRDAIFASELLKRHDLKSTTALVQWMQAQNEVLAAKFQQAAAAGKANPKALEKAKQYDFYLGLESSWLYN